MPTGSDPVGIFALADQRLMVASLAKHRSVLGLSAVAGVRSNGNLAGSVRHRYQLTYGFRTTCGGKSARHRSSWDLPYPIDGC